MPLTLRQDRSADAPVMDRVITLTLEYQEQRNAYGEFESTRELHKVWASREAIDVDVMPTEKGMIESGRVAYVVRWFDHAPTASEKINLRPAIVGVHDEVGFHIVTGVHDVVGHRGRYLTIFCEGTR